MEKTMWKALWSAAFGDDGWIDSFFRTAYRPENTLAIFREGQLAAGLAWMQTSCQGRKLAYLYAVATAPEYRHQGLCRELMTNAQEALAARGYDGSVLVPADEGLRRMYAAMGYRNFGGVENLTLPAGAPVPLREVTPEEYAALRRDYLPQGGIVQENGAIEYLAQSARLCAGNGFLLAAAEDEPMELLGDASQAAGILGALGKPEGTFRLPGPSPFAMFRPICDDSWTPAYFGLDFA